MQALLRESVLRAQESESSYELWLAPLICIGEVKGALAIEASEGIATWAARRYGRFIGEAVRETTEFRGAFIFVAEPEPKTDEEAML